MSERRDFLKASLCGGVSLLSMPPPSGAFAHADDDGRIRDMSYRLSRDVPTRMYDGKRCWCHPRAGIVP